VVGPFLSALHTIHDGRRRIAPEEESTTIPYLGCVGRYKGCPMSTLQQIGRVRILFLWTVMMSLRRSTAFLRLSSTKITQGSSRGHICTHICTQPPTISRVSSRQTLYRPFLTTTYLQTDSDDQVLSDSSRKHLLHQSLVSIHIDADELYDAALQSIENPTDGYDGRYGRSAIRTYRAFLFPKKDDVSPTTHEDYNLKLKAAAGRCARQIDFLLKRHKSHQADWVRHNDLPEEAQRQTFPLILLLDNVRSAFNVGSIFRTADAAGCERVLTTGITPHPNGSGAEKLHKSALGAELVVPSQHFATTQEAIEFLRRELPDYQLVGMETTERSITYTDMSYSTSGTVLVLGNEVTGVDTDILPELGKFCRAVYLILPLPMMR
jgi:tRNA(Leu) C34 or U34 (ribose-2'-O)-methylase TrmL